MNWQALLVVGNGCIIGTCKSSYNANATTIYSFYAFVVSGKIKNHKLKDRQYNTHSQKEMGKKTNTDPNPL
jgi:hypothetical protein